MLDLESYSVIEIQFAPAVLDQAGSLSDATTKYFIKIEPGNIINSGINQLLPLPVKKAFRLNEPLILYLAPSTMTVPTVKYKASYYKESAREPFLIEDWVVPKPLNKSKVSLRLDGTQLEYELPSNFWKFKALISTLTIPAYKIQDNRSLVFDIAPPEGEVSLQYTGKYTRADLIWPKN